MAAWFMLTYDLTTGLAVLLQMSIALPGPLLSERRGTFSRDRLEQRVLNE